MRPPALFGLRGYSLFSALHGHGKHRSPESLGDDRVGVGAEQNLFRGAPQATVFHMEEGHAQLAPAMLNGFSGSAQPARCFGIRHLADNGLLLCCPKMRAVRLDAELPPFVFDRVNRASQTLGDNAIRSGSEQSNLRVPPRQPRCRWAWTETQEIPVRLDG